MSGHQKIVSIVTPCYNAEKYVDRLLTSVLSQTYPDVQMTVIDDGSTDASADIIKSYIPQFKERGYLLDYVYQKNQGQSVAINNGLKKVKGSYLVWPDADDFYADKTSISQMVEVLDSTDDSTSMVRVQYNVLADKTLKLLYQWGVDDETRYKTDLFEDYLFNMTNSMWAVPGGYMAKVSKVDALIPHREIYTEKHAGQNFQIMLPLLYKHKCLTIEKYLYNVVDHPDSHSRNIDTAVLRRDIYRRTVTHTLDNMPLDGQYKKFILRKYLELLKPLQGAGLRKGGTRTFIKRAVKAITPYGIIVLYRRRVQR